MIAMALAFNRVVVAGNQEFSADDFLQLPLDVRIRHILGRSIAFFLGADPVDRKLALKSIRGLGDGAG